jgi:RNA polymerase sigma factor (sigma-70 family)
MPPGVNGRFGGDTHWTPNDWIGSKWNGYRCSYRDFPLNKWGKSCSQFADRVTHPHRQVKPDFFSMALIQRGAAVSQTSRSALKFPRRLNFSSYFSLANPLRLIPPGGTQPRPEVFLCASRFGGCYNLKMTTDSELLRQFAHTNAEAAFAELVKRHVNLVYSAALRQVNGDAHLAQDVAQTVFTDLARKAGSLADRKNLTGWLYTSAHFAAAKMVRTETRRRDREETFMREPANESGTGFQPVQSANEIEWVTLRPLLDAAMHELKETDREAILLRYFENQPFIQIGAKLGLNENAARMRVERALEKLRGVVTKRGLATTATLAAVLSAKAVQLAPAGLAATLATVSIVTAGTGTLTLMKIMTLTKLKLGISTLVLAGAATALVVQYQAQEKLRSENGSLTQQVAQLESDSENFSNRLASAGNSKKLPDDQFNELLRLRGEVGVLRRQLDEAGNLRTENIQIRKELADAVQTLQSLPSPKQALFDKKRIQAINAARYLSLAMRIWAGDNNDKYPTNFSQITNELAGVTNQTQGLDPRDAFEFVNAGMFKENYPQMLTVREIVPRQAPDGTWERVYGLADGSVHSIVSDTGNFDKWEKEQQQYNPPTNQ